MKAPPSDPNDRLVYADYLQSTGDPRGELIVLQNTRHEASGTPQLEAAARAEAVHLLAHQKVLLGDINESVVSLAWDLGYIREAYFSDKATPEDLHALLTTESARFLKRVGVRWSSDEDWAKIRTLLIECDQELDGLYLNGTDAGRLDPLITPHLKRLWLSVRGPAGFETAAENLEYFRYSGRALEDPETKLPTRWPSLKLLRFERHGSEEGALLQRYEAFFGKADLPVVEHLGVVRTHGYTDRMCTVVTGLECFGRLTYLDLSHGDMSVDGAKVLAEAAKDSALQIINIDRNAVESMPRELNATGADIHYGVQNTDSGKKSNLWGRIVQNRDLYERPDGDHCDTAGLQGRLRKTKKKGLEAVIQILDSVPLMSPYRHGAVGTELTEKVLQYLAKGDQYESVLRICRETPHDARTALIERYAVLAHLVAGRFEEAQRVRTGTHGDEILDLFARWADAELGDPDAAEALAHTAQRRDSRWAKFAAAAALMRRDPKLAAGFLRDALDDVMPTVPPLPCEAAMRRIFADLPAAARLIGPAD